MRVILLKQQLKSIIIQFNIQIFLSTVVWFWIHRGKIWSRVDRQDIGPAYQYFTTLYPLSDRIFISLHSTARTSDPSKLKQVKSNLISSNLINNNNKGRTWKGTKALQKCYLYHYGTILFLAMHIPSLSLLLLLPLLLLSSSTDMYELAQWTHRHT